MQDNKIFDAKGNEIKVTQDDFKLCQSDVKIHDVKFETRPTTFFKDALKRFRKNKSSVVATFIIGFLIIMAIFVPIFSPYDIKTTSVEESLLPPKLFEAGTGWWDGTKSYTHIPYDVTTEAPSGFKGDSVIKYTNSVEEYINVTNASAHGGYYIIQNNKGLNMTGSADDNLIYFQPYVLFDFNTNQNYSVKINFMSEDNVYSSKLGEYRIILTYKDIYDNEQIVILKDWSKDYGEVAINITEAIKNQANLMGNTLNDARFRIQLKPISGQTTYFGFESLVFETDATGTAQETFENYSITDANYSVALGRLTDGSFPVGYWQSTGDKRIYQAAITYVDFVYDVYKATLGDLDRQVGKTRMDTYILNGWCEYDYTVGPSSFKILDSEKCPVREVYSQQSVNVGGNISYTLDCKVTNYKYLGYNSMPKYIFGSTNEGYDMFTYAFNGLRTSLILAIVSSAICMIFGVCWGSISGYFGGNVDLIMERFCEIISGVPWIVVMTLTILLLGNNIITFGLALCLTGWIGVAGRTRTQFYRFKGREYVLASRTLGASNKRLIFRHILPNSLGTIVTSSILMIPSVIFSEATLSYLNLGLQGVDSFGLVLSKNQQYLATSPMLVVFPAIIVSLLMISFNLFGNGLRDALNPSLKGSE